MDSAAFLANIPASEIQGGPTYNHFRSPDDKQSSSDVDAEAISL